MALKRGRVPRAATGYSAMHSGLGRVLTAVYGIFALAATARAGYEFATKLGDAPLPYTLSLFSALVYILATVCLVVGNRVTHRIAVLSCSIELIGVVIIGVLSMAAPSLFAKTDGSGEIISTVWSGFGIGYGCIPLVLPVLGLWWLYNVGRKVAAQQSAEDAQES